MRISIAALALLALASGCAAHQLALRSANWVEVRTEHVLLRTDVSQALAVPIAEMLQETRDAFAENVLSECFARAGARPLEVTLLDQPALFRTIAGTGAVAFEFESDTWDDDTRRIVLTSRLDVPTRRTFQHELTHRLVHACFAHGVPTWLDEGLASFYETAVLANGEMRIGIPTFAFERIAYPSVAASGLAFRVPLRSFVDASSLRALTPEAFFGVAIADRSRKHLVTVGHYASAWSLVHMLKLGDPATAARWDAYLVDLSLVGTGDAAGAWSRRYGDLDVDAMLRAYVARDRYEYLALPHASGTRTAPALRAMEPEEAHLELATLFGASSDTQSGAEARREQRLLHARAAMQSPTTRARARLMLAEDRYRSGDRDEAIADVRATYAASPDDPWVMRAWLDVLLAGTSRCARDSDVARLASALADRAVTAAQRTTAADALGSCGDVERALGLARSAVELDPESLRGRLVLAKALAMSGRFPQALDAVDAALATVRHGGGPESMQRILAFRHALAERGARHVVTRRPIAD